MVTDSSSISAVGQRPTRVHINTNQFNVYNAMANYSHMSLPEGTNTKPVLQLIGNAGLDNYKAFATTGLNKCTQESGTLDGGVNFQPTSSYKHRMFFEQNGFYPPSEKGWVA